MISRPTYQDSDWWKFSIWKSRICLSVTSFYTSQQCGRNVHDVIFENCVEFPHFLIPAGDTVQVVYRQGTDTSPLVAVTYYYLNGFSGFRI